MFILFIWWFQSASIWRTFASFSMLIYLCRCAYFFFLQCVIGNVYYFIIYLFTNICNVYEKKNSIKLLKCGGDEIHS